MIINGLKNHFKSALVKRSIPKPFNLIPFQSRLFSSQPPKNSESLQEEIDKKVKEEEDFFLSNVKPDLKQNEVDRIKKHQVFDPNIHKDEDSLVKEDDSRFPLSVRERWQTIKVFELFKEKAQWGEFYRVYGMLLILFGGYFLVVPFYDVVCQTFGFSMRRHAVNYHFQDDQINVFKKFRVSFMSHTEDDLPWEFQAQTPTVVINAGETCLAFYKVFNKSNKPIAGIAIYQVWPEEVQIYFNKIQCFCFENQLLYPNESIDLPVLFYLDPAINHDIAVDTKDIVLTYHFFPSADQTIAKVLQEEIEKHEKEQKKLIEIRKGLKDKGVELEEMKPGVIAPGHNPKDSPEMFVRKIMKNQERLNHTIQIYEEIEKEKESLEKEGGKEANEQINEIKKLKESVA